MEVTECFKFSLRRHLTRNNAMAGGLMFTILTLISLEVVKFHSLTGLKVMVYVTVLAGNSMVVSTSPLLMEFGVEKLYPINEGMIGGWLNIW